MRKPFWLAEENNLAVPVESTSPRIRPEPECVIRIDEYRRDICVGNSLVCIERQQDGSPRGRVHDLPATGAPQSPTLIRKKSDHRNIAERTDRPGLQLPPLMDNKAIPGPDPDAPVQALSK